MVAGSCRVPTLPTTERDDTALDDFVLSLAPTDLPRVCFVGTASGDPTANEERFRDAFAGRARCSVLRLFDREVADLDAFLAGSTSSTSAAAARSTCSPSGGRTVWTARFAARTRPAS